MNSTKLNSIELGKLGLIFAGTKSVYLEKNNDTAEDKIISVLNWSNLKKLINKQDIEPITQYKINSQIFYKKSISFIKKGDILFFSLPGSAADSLIYVDKDLDDNYLCNDNIYIFRNESKYSSEYIYLILKSGLYDKYIKYLQDNNKKKITSDMLSKIEIPLSKDEQELVNEFKRIEKEKNEIQQQEDELYEKVHKLTKNILNI